MAASPTILERLKGYLLPCVLIIASTYFLIQTALTSPRLLLTDFASFRSLAFAKFWLAMGPTMAADVPPSLPALLASCRGVILDVGPGAGDQLSRFSAAAANITRVYGVEPGVEMHDALRANADKAGLGGGKYRVLACGAEPESLVPALAKEGLLRKEAAGGDERNSGSSADAIFDEIVCVRVLCGVPHHSETIAGLYRHLKPGGRFVVFEHVVNDDHSPGGWGWVGRLLQRAYMAAGWPFFAGGCELRRDTRGALMRAAEKDGGWKEVRLETLDAWAVVPHVVGFCVKKG